MKTNKKEKIILGESIRKKIVQKNISYSDFAKKISLSREELRLIMQKDSLNTKLLLLISLKLNYNFFKELSLQLKSIG